MNKPLNTGVAALSQNDDYKNWLVDLKQQVLQTQIKAAVQVNSTLLQLYWQLGADIVELEQKNSWGEGLIKQLSNDLMAEFATIKGFSERNIRSIRQWFMFWTAQANSLGNIKGTNVKQLVSHLSQIPWGHNLKIIAQTKNTVEARFYVENTIEHGWSRNVLTHQIQSGLWQREGQSVNNFTNTLPVNLQSDLPSIEAIENELGGEA